MVDDVSVLGAYSASVFSTQNSTKKNVASERGKHQ
jgi:hypothetical protein